MEECVSNAVAFGSAATAGPEGCDARDDADVGHFVLHHSGDPHKVLTEAFRVLHPRGRWGVPSGPTLTGRAGLVRCLPEFGEAESGAP